MKKRSWVVASTFVWCLAGAVAIAAYSGRPPVTPAQPEHDHASHAGQPHVDEPATDAIQTGGATNATTGGGTAAATAGRNPAPPTSILPNEVRWEENFEAAMQRARTEGKPILIDFYADWCSPCKEMDARVYPDGNVIDQSQKWITVKVNGEKRPDVMQAYGVSGYPTLVFAQPDGKPVASTTGYLDAPQLVQQMQDAHSKWSSKQDRA